MLNYPDLGTVSHGTMKTSDLLRRFADTLATICDGEFASIHAKRIAYAKSCADDLDRDATPSVAGFYQERAGDALNDLFDWLDTYAPPFCYFGSNEGDGSDYGFWPSWDAVDNGEYEGEIVRINDGDCVADALRINPGHDYVMSVSDHGNVIMYQRTPNGHAEAWSIV